MHTAARCVPGAEARLPQRFMHSADLVKREIHAKLLDNVECLASC